MYMFFLLVFVFVSISFILLVMLQEGKGIQFSSSDHFSNNLSLLKHRSLSTNKIVSYTSVIAVTFFILNLILCMHFVNKKNKSIILKTDNTLILSLNKKNFLQQSSIDHIDIPQ